MKNTVCNDCILKDIKNTFIIEKHNYFMMQSSMIWKFYCWCLTIKSHCNNKSLHPTFDIFLIKFIDKHFFCQCIGIMLLLSLERYKIEWITSGEEALKWIRPGVIVQFCWSDGYQIMIILLKLELLAFTNEACLDKVICSYILNFLEHYQRNPGS